MIFECPPRTSRGHLRSASIGPKTTSTNDWLRVERHGSLTPRLGNSLASRHLEPFRSLAGGPRIDHPQRRSAAATAGINSSRARDDATLIPNLSDKFVKH